MNPSPDKDACAALLDGLASQWMEAGHYIYATILTDAANKVRAYSLPDCDLIATMRCVDCGHVQTVKGLRREGHCYYGSAYNWCDECDGLPKIESVEEVK